MSKDKDKGRREKQRDEERRKAREEKRHERELLPDPEPALNPWGRKLYDS